MENITKASGLQPGEKNDTIDLDYRGCLGYCSKAPNVEINDTHVIFQADPDKIMEEIEEGGEDMSGRVITLDDALDEGFLDTEPKEESTANMSEQEYKEAHDSDKGVAIPADLPEEISQGIRQKGKYRRVVVDREACIGARSCALVAPGVFQMDDGDLAYVVEGHENTDEDTLLMSAQSCPVLAIHLYDEDGKKVFPEE